MNKSQQVESRRTHLLKLGGILAGAGLAGCLPRPGRLGPLQFEPGRTIRVALKLEAQSVVIGGAGGVQVSADGRDVSRLRISETVAVENSSGAVAIGNRQYESAEFRPTGAGGAVAVDGTRYRGTVVVTAGSEGLTVVNYVALEDYLQGVVPVELGDRPMEELAALEAQAIAARTYTAANLGRFDSQGFDLRAGVSDQAYGGLDRETPGGNRAVRNTAGIILEFEGEPVSVFYHSTCGYATAYPGEVFRNTLEVPYLVSVSDESRGGYFCDPSPRFRWNVTWSNAELRTALRETLPSRIGIDPARVESIQDVSVYATGPSGRATELRVHVPAGAIPIFGADVRAVFRLPDGGTLNSTAIQLSSESSGEGLVSLTAAGAGFGHGVGMCQWGAIGRARAGQNVRQILTTYFPGVSFANWS